MYYIKSPEDKYANRHTVWCTCLFSITWITHPFIYFYLLRSRWLEETQELKSYITSSKDPLTQDSLIPHRTHSVGCFHSDGWYWQRSTQNYSWHLIGLFRGFKTLFLLLPWGFFLQVAGANNKVYGNINTHIFLPHLMINSLRCICMFPEQLLQSNPKHEQEVKWGAECPPASKQPLCSHPCSTFLW